jgi:[ribosomal protein S5]-alanine N-acetyltransferase
MIIFSSQHLYVKPYTEADAAIFYELNGDREVMQYIREPKTRAESDAFLQENLELYKQLPGLGRFAVFTNDTKEFVGSFSLLSIDNSDNIHLGYALLKKFHGKGLATELVKASLPYVFATIQQETVHALTVAENIASQKVLLKCGFQFSHTMQHDGDEVMVFELKEKNRKSEIVFRNLD